MTLWETIWKSILLGTVQGLTEFLPVSSSGHLSLLQRLMGYDIGGSATFVNVMLHLGSLLAVTAVLGRDIFMLFQKPYKRLLWLFLASLPAAAVGVLFEDFIDGAFAGQYGLLWLALCFLVTAGVLLLVEGAAGRRRGKPFGLKNALLMGLGQAVALFPGISRSGATIAAGTLSGGKTEEVVRFSFLMSIPVILGSVLLEGIGIAAQPTPVSSYAIVGMACGVASAALSGYLSVRFMLRLKKGNYRWFSLYLAILSLGCLWLFWLAVV